MQSTSAKSPRTFQPRDCADCQVSFVPASAKTTRCPGCQEIRAEQVAREAHLRKMERRKVARTEAREARPGCSECGAPLRRSNTIGRCQEHRYIGEGMGACGVCGKKLRRDNQIGFCEAHKYATARTPERFCLTGCGTQLRADNESGYCKRHAQLTPNVLRYREEQAAAERAASQERRDARDPCEIDGCPNRIRSDNTLGRCNDHRYLPLGLPECSVIGCEKRLHTDNVIGRCMEHRGLYWAPSALKCRAEGCGKTLHADNALGYCHDDRGQSPEWREYQRSYYLSRQDELVEYARFYREVYAEEHRAAALAWALANPDRKKDNDAAYRERNREAIRERWNAAGYFRNTPAQYAANARRRQRIKVDMDQLDRALSAAYRTAIRNDPCFYCGDPETHHVDHFFPLAKGGTDVWVNLVRACADCNLSKSATCGTAFLLRAGLVSLDRAA